MPGTVRSTSYSVLHLVITTTLCRRLVSPHHVRLFGTPWTVAHQAPLSMGFSRQACWSGKPGALPTEILCSGPRWCRGFHAQPRAPFAPQLQLGIKPLPGSDRMRFWPQHPHSLLFTISQGGWSDGKSVHLAMDWLLNTGQLLPSLGSWAHGLQLGFATCWWSQHLSFSFLTSKKEMMTASTAELSWGWDTWTEAPSTNPWISTIRALTLHTGKLPFVVKPTGQGSCGLIHPGI